jgi:hypothetical protein
MIACWSTLFHRFSRNENEAPSMLCAVGNRIELLALCDSSSQMSSATSSSSATTSATRRKRARTADVGLDSVRVVSTLQFDDDIDAFGVLNGDGSERDDDDNNDIGGTNDAVNQQQPLLLIVSLANDALALATFDESGRGELLWQTDDECLRRRDRGDAKLVRCHPTARVCAILVENARLVVVHVAPPPPSSSSLSSASGDWSVALGVAPLHYVAVRDFCWFRARLAAPNDDASLARSTSAAGPSSTSSSAATTAPGESFMYGVLHGVESSLALAIGRATLTTSALVVAPSAMPVNLPQLTTHLHCTHARK